MTNIRQTEALDRATQNQSFANYPAIIDGFLEKGISEADIQPRVNVFTFNAWKALGRSVKKGEHGVKVHTWIVLTDEDDDGKETTRRIPRTTTVFHVTQTKEL